MNSLRGKTLRMWRTESWTKVIPGRANSKCKGPNISTCLEYLKKNMIFKDLKDDEAPDRLAFHSVQLSVMSDSLWPHGPQHARPPCPSLTPRVYSNSSPLSWWCHPTISSFAIPFSSHLQSFPRSGSFQMSQFFESGGQSIGVSASASVLPMSTQDWSPLGWTGWISLQSKGLSRVFSKSTVQKHQSFSAQLSLWSSSHILTWLLRKP